MTVGWALGAVRPRAAACLVDRVVRRAGYPDRAPAWAFPVRSGAEYRDLATVARYPDRGGAVAPVRA
jgi:hypothetical protein